MDIPLEIDESTKTLERTLGIPIEYFVMPYNACDPDVLDYLQHDGAIWGRDAGETGLNPANFTDTFQTNYDTWGPSYDLLHFAQGPCARTADGGVPVQWDTEPSAFSPECRAYVLSQFLTEVVASRGWGVRVFHGFQTDSGAFQSISQADYEAHLDLVKAKVDAGSSGSRDRGSLFAIAGPERNALCLGSWKAARSTSRGPATSAEDRHERHVRRSDCRFLRSACARSTTGRGASMAKKIGPGRFLVNADPLLGDVVLGQ